MCSSKAAGVAVDDLCKGSIAAHLQDNITVGAAQQFAAWMVKHGHLMHSVHLGEVKQGQAAAIAAGLQAAAAAAAPGGLCLQQFHSTFQETSSTDVISLLPPAHLTSLKLLLTSAHNTQQMAAAILRLKKLRNVTVASPEDPAAGASPVLSALSGLSHLKSLHLQRCLPPDAVASILQCLPASLVELRITNATCED